MSVLIKLILIILISRRMDKNIILLYFLYYTTHGHNMACYVGCAEEAVGKKNLAHPTYAEYNKSSICDSAEYK